MIQKNVQIKTLRIDGRDCGAREDQSILDVAIENGIFIPTLCHMDGLHEIGACRLCLVEVKGSPKLLPACVTRVQEARRIEQDAVDICPVRPVDRRDGLALHVGVEDVEFDIEPPRLPAQVGVQFLGGDGAVQFRLAAAQILHVGALDQQQLH